MQTSGRPALAVPLIALGLLGWTPALPQQLPFEPAHDSGQSITGAFEGWFPNPDGTISLLAGYFNRNLKQELEIPAGPNNRIEPGGPDRGQPSHFLPGRQWGVFAVKLPKAITHERRLADVAAPLRAFLAAIEPLGPRAHALWVQLPPSFSPADLGALTGFLKQLPREYRYCVEVRHREFFEDQRTQQQLERVLGDAGAEWVTFDTTVLFGSRPVTDAEREAWTRKPRLPRRSRALTSHPVIRYLGRDDAARTVAGWQPWLSAIADWLREGRSPTVFIHTPDNVAALELARRFHDAVRARVPEVEPLPEPVPAGPPTLF